MQVYIHDTLLLTNIFRKKVVQQTDSRFFLSHFQRIGLIYIEKECHQEKFRDRKYGVLKSFLKYFYYLDTKI